MQVSKRTVELLKDLNNPCLGTNVIVADLQKVQYGILNDKSLDFKNYWHKSLSKNILTLIDSWKNKNFSDDLFFFSNKDIKQIIEDDTIKYSSEVIFPIFVDSKLDGIAIFFKTKGIFNITTWFNFDWFSQENMDFVDDEIEIYISKLLDIDDYVKINHELQQLTLKLTSSLTSEQRTLLESYQNVELQISSYQNSLAYYLGLNNSSNSKKK